MRTRCLTPGGCGCRRQIPTHKRLSEEIEAGRDAAIADEALAIAHGASVHFHNLGAGIANYFCDNEEQQLFTQDRALVTCPACVRGLAGEKGQGHADR